MATFSKIFKRALKWLNLIFVNDVFIFEGLWASVLFGLVCCYIFCAHINICWNKWTNKLYLLKPLLHILEYKEGLCFQKMKWLVRCHEWLVFGCVQTTGWALDGNVIDFKHHYWGSFSLKYVFFLSEIHACLGWSLFWNFGGLTKMHKCVIGNINHKRDFSLPGGVWALESIRFNSWNDPIRLQLIVPVW